MLNIGFDAHVINDRIFLVMVMMALVTTFMTTPMISIIYPKCYHEKSSAATTKNIASTPVESDAAKLNRATSVTEFLPKAAKLPVRMMVLVDNIEPVSLMTKLIWLFKPAKSVTDDLFVTAIKVIRYLLFNEVSGLNFCNKIFRVSLNNVYYHHNRK